MPAAALAIEPILLETIPEPLQIDLQRTALVIIDMQNAFVSKGGMLDLMGKLDVSAASKVVEVTNNVIRAARARGMRVIYVVRNHSLDLREIGGPNSGYWYKAFLPGYAEHPEWKDKCLLRGTWGAEIVKGLDFKEDDIVVVKPRYSAFYGTNLDSILKTFDIKYLVFTGIATNICVETAIRDAVNFDYFSILISDATTQGGPPTLKMATIQNVTQCFGWVATSEDFVKALTK
jgi:ureidoacrylate peracid hydrolase